MEGSLGGVRGGDKTALALASIESDIETRDRAIFHTETDKPLHKPGEVVHLRTLIFDDSGHALANTAITLVINDADNKRLIEAPLKTNRFGIASYDWKTSPAACAPGSMKRTSMTTTALLTTKMLPITLPIERYDLPEFSVSATMDRSFYLAQTDAGREDPRRVSFWQTSRRGNNQPVIRLNDESWYTRRKQAGEKAEPVANGTLDGNGDASFTLDVKGDFADLGERQYERYLDIPYRAIVTDASTGRSEPRKFTVRLTRDAVHNYLSQPLGDDREGDVIVSTSYADGTPVACKIGAGLG